MFLLDTNVISELRKPKPHGAVLAWLRQTNEADLRISAMTVAEIQRGIELTRLQSPEKASEIEAWLNQVEDSMDLLPLDATVMRRWATLMHGKTKHHWEDGMIAAVALTHHLTVVTRNTSDFVAFDVRVINPFEFA